MADLIRPDYLCERDRIAVIAPAFRADAGLLDNSLSVLKRWGLVPELGRSVRCFTSATADGVSEYSGSDRERADDLVWALGSDEFKAVLCVRGGYGSLHLLDLLPDGIFGRNPKWLIGFSDITTLHAASVSEGVMSIHGNMCVNIGRTGGLDDSSLALRDMLFGRAPGYDIQSRPFSVPGVAEGILVGGNLITLSALLGTKTDFLRHRDAILFVEEVGESFHAIDRLVNVLLRSSGFENVRGLVFGEFTDCMRDLPYDSVEEMIYPYVKDLGIPVCFGFPAGHGTRNVPFIEGAHVLFEVYADSRVELKYKNI